MILFWHSQLWGRMSSCSGLLTRALCAYWRHISNTLATCATARFATIESAMLVSCPNRLLLLSMAAISALSAQERIVVDSVADLQACVDRPAGAPLVCTLRNSPQPYAITGAILTIRRSDTTVEGASEPGQDPPTLKRTD